MKLKQFMEEWVSMLWHAMMRRGRGYRRHSLRRTGVGADRRGDKLDGMSKHARAYRARYQCGGGR